MSIREAPAFGPWRNSMRLESRFKIGRGLLFAGFCLSLTSLALADETGRKVILSGQNPETLAQPSEAPALAEKPSGAPDSLGTAPGRLAPLEYSDSVLARSAREARNTRIALGISMTA